AMQRQADVREVAFAGCLDDDRRVTAHRIAHIVEGEIARVAQRLQQREEGVVALKTGTAATPLDSIGPEVGGAPGWDGTTRRRIFPCDAKCAFPGNLPHV